MPKSLQRHIADVDLSVVRCGLLQKPEEHMRSIQTPLPDFASVFVTLT
jgi:hypothetical protein